MAKRRKKRGRGNDEYVAPEYLPTEHQGYPVQDYQDIYPPQTPGNFLTSPNRVSLGEAITFISLLYVCSISAFNAGYFSHIPGQFVELFSFADLIGTNIKILQYFISAFSSFCLLSFFGGAALAALNIDLRAAAERLAISHHINFSLFIGGVLVLWGSAMLTFGLLGYFKITNFTLLVLPEFIFQGVLIFFFWVGYKYEYGTFRSFVIPALIGLIMFSTASGRAWLKSELAASNDVQSLITSEGHCLDRKILRTSTNGLLLYNLSMHEYEFRSKESIRTIFQRRSCA